LTGAAMEATGTALFDRAAAITVLLSNSQLSCSQKHTKAQNTRWKTKDMKMSTMLVHAYETPVLTDRHRKPKITKKRDLKSLWNSAADRSSHKTKNNKEKRSKVIMKLRRWQIVTENQE
jgi:hypothetical protein